MRDKRDQKELVETSKHLAYELQMFLATTQMMIIGIPNDQVDLKNAVLESFLIHLRNLIHFFYASKPSQDDVFVQDFFEPSTPMVIPAKSSTLETAQKRANKEIAHFTYTRNWKTKEDKQWVLHILTAEMTLLFIKFLKSVPKEHIAWESFSFIDLSGIEGVQIS